jgi:hypothetical protein
MDNVLDVDICLFGSSSRFALEYQSIRLSRKYQAGLHTSRALADADCIRQSDRTLVGAQSTFSHLSRFDELDHSLSVSTLVSAQDTVFYPSSCILAQARTHCCTIIRTNSKRSVTANAPAIIRNSLQKGKLSNTRSTTHI